MRILIVNTSEQTGGAAVAASRLMDALNNNGVKAKMLVRDKTTSRMTVVGLKSPWLSRWRFLWERLAIFIHLRCSREHLFEIDTAFSGHDITNLPEFKEADIIHLHWINQGMLSLKGIQKIIDSGKPVVWTMHDIWAATAICHYARGCTNFHDRCSCCRLLPNGGSSHDLSAKIWEKKDKMLKSNKFWFVTCSKWLGTQAVQSALLRGHHVVSIPNAIDTKMFHPSDKTYARQQIGITAQNKRLILFVAQRVTDERKGMPYFIEALQHLANARPEMHENTGVVILGGRPEEITGNLPFEVYPMGYVGDPKQIVQIYCACDVFVLPSLEDNLPNTIMEAMACGVPCVGFNVGGIPEMIDHCQNGYVAQYKDAQDLARGIHWVLSEAEKLSRNAVAKVAMAYSQQTIATQYIKVYQQALDAKKR